MEEKHHRRETLVLFNIHLILWSFGYGRCCYYHITHQLVLLSVNFAKCSSTKENSEYSKNSKNSNNKFMLKCHFVILINKLIRQSFIITCWSEEQLYSDKEYWNNYKLIMHLNIPSSSLFFSVGEAFLSMWLTMNSKSSL
jgi:hypothetical protein